MSLIDEMQIPTANTPTVYCDNIGATYLAANKQNQVQASKIRVSHVTSADQPADALTKPLTQSKHDNLCSKIGLAKGGPS